MPKPILFLEINELPWRVIYKYRHNKDYPNIERFFSLSTHYTTETVDRGELSPWITWPTMHRGISSDDHKIRYLGQNPSTYQGTPIWEEIRRRGANIGIFGSMQSWPPIDPGKNGFFIPDTFAHDECCIPNYLSPLQKFNLSQVSENARIVNGGLLKSSIHPMFLYSLIRSGIKIKTLFRIAKQLLLEKKDPTYKSRRPIFQTILFWDVFKSLYKPNSPPEFSTFFTNHIASIMHRYWNHIFPEDFPEELRPKIYNHESTMNFAIKIFDEMLGDVLRWHQLNPNLTIFMASSMGQNSILRTEHVGYEFILQKIERLLVTLGFNETGYKKLLAMAPQVAIQVEDSEKRIAITEALESCRTQTGSPLFDVTKIADTLSITTINPKTTQDAIAPGFYDSKKNHHSWESAGIQIVQIEPGTAYHIPEGVLCVLGKNQSKFAMNQSSKKIMANEVKEKILQLFDEQERSITSL